VQFCPACGSSLVAEVKVTYPGGQIQEFTVPPDIPIGKLSSALAYQLGLDIINDDGVPIAYQLYAEGIAQPLDPLLTWQVCQERLPSQAIVQLVPEALKHR
jgi:hypothetical protein